MWLAPYVRVPAT
jgi:hypothetical protein